MLSQQINILGTEYNMEYKTELEDPILHNCTGYIDVTTKRIIIEQLSRDSIDCMDELKKLEDECKLHEIIHAFFSESGLKEYYEDEMLVQWIAMQLPKINKVYGEVVNKHITQ